MKSRLPILALALAAVLGGNACLQLPTSADQNGGLAPDTLPLSIADSTITFSINTSSFYAGDSIQVFFTVKNNGSTTRTIEGSSGCTFTVNAYNSSGALVSPKNRACTDDLHHWATLSAGESISFQRWWRATDQSSSPGMADLPPGVYNLEPFLDAFQFQRTGRRLIVQIAKR